MGICIRQAAVRAVSAAWLAGALALPASADTGITLDVPFVRQTKAMCGPAAATMVLRYWGDDAADVRQFAGLIDRARGGISTDVLSKAIEDREWRVVRFAGSAETVKELLRANRPVIVLLEEGKGRYHYVVVIGMTDMQFLVHDPARGPSRRIPIERFLRRWEPAGFWALLAFPGPSVAGGVQPPVQSSVEPGAQQ